MDVSVSFNKIPPHCCVTQFSSENEREALCLHDDGALQQQVDFYVVGPLQS